MLNKIVVDTTNIQKVYSESQQQPLPSQSLSSPQPQIKSQKPQVGSTILLRTTRNSIMEKGEPASEESSILEMAPSIVKKEEPVSGESNILEKVSSTIVHESESSLSATAQSSILAIKNSNSETFILEKPTILKTLKVSQTVPISESSLISESKPSTLESQISCELTLSQPSLLSQTSLLTESVISSSSKTETYVNQETTESKTASISLLSPKVSSISYSSSLLAPTTVSTTATVSIPLVMASMPIVPATPTILRTINTKLATNPAKLQTQTETQPLPTLPSQNNSMGQSSFRAIIPKPDHSRITVNKNINNIAPCNKFPTVSTAIAPAPNVSPKTLTEAQPITQTLAQTQAQAIVLQPTASISNNKPQSQSVVHSNVPAPVLFASSNGQTFALISRSDAVSKVSPGTPMIAALTAAPCKTALQTSGNPSGTIPNPSSVTNGNSVGETATIRKIETPNIAVGTRRIEIQPYPLVTNSMNNVSTLKPNPQIQKLEDSLIVKTSQTHQVNNEDDDDVILIENDDHMTTNIKTNLKQSPLAPLQSSIQPPPSIIKNENDPRVILNLENDFDWVRFNNPPDMQNVRRFRSNLEVKNNFLAWANYELARIFCRNDSQKKVQLCKLPNEVFEWTPKNVATFLTTVGYPKLAKFFLEQEMDGMSLLLLQIDDVVNHLGLKAASAYKLWAILYRFHQTLEEFVY